MLSDDAAMEGAGAPSDPPESQSQGQGQGQNPDLLTYDGDVIAELNARLPAMNVEPPEAYPRNTILRLKVEVRVKSVRFDENRKGELVRDHVLALESIDVVAAFKPEDAVDSTSGSGSAQRTQTPEDIAELGLQIGRTSDQWDEELRRPEISVVDGKVVNTETGEVLGAADLDPEEDVA